VDQVTQSTNNVTETVKTKVDQSTTDLIGTISMKMEQSKKDVNNAVMTERGAAMAKSTNKLMEMGVQSVNEPYAVADRGHRANAPIKNEHLEAVNHHHYTEHYPKVTEDNSSIIEKESQFNQQI
jgi:hypothetical protein